MNELASVFKYYNLIDNFSSQKIKILCPFHGDVNASMQVDFSKNQFFCFGCNAKGGPVEFIKGIENCNDLQALMILHKALNNHKGKNIKIEKDVEYSSEEAIAEARRYYASLPSTNWYKHSNARAYMLKRGFTIKTLYDVYARENMNADYELVFPILDNGKFVGYVCRATNPEMESKRKYLYNKGFSRYNSLFGNYNAPYVVITEGSMDYFKLRQYGIYNAIAILGWRITDNQIAKIKCYTNNVISALDNTDTGNQGTEYLKKHFNVVRLKMPEHIKDIGDMDIYDFNYAWQNTVIEAKKNGFKIK